jgi:ABC-type molybdate transport system substrate-binding protein
MNRKYPEIPSERSEDLYNLDLVDRSELVLFMAGNQFMVMQELIATFQKIYPDIKNIYYETLPPGLELKQILAGGAIFRGKLLNVFPDIYSAVNIEAMRTLEESNLIEKESYFPYLHNRLTLMVPSGNPAHIEAVTDLGKKEVRISQPDPKNEDIAHHIINMYRQAGGEALVKRIMHEKVVAGTTVLTTVHHRETPFRIKEKTVDVGPVWATEAVYARESGLAFDIVEPDNILDQRERVNYYICRLKNGGNQENAEKFLLFIKSKPAQKIYEQHGFVPGFG